MDILNWIFGKLLYGLSVIVWIGAGLAIALQGALWFFGWIHSPWTIVFGVATLIIIVCHMLGIQSEPWEF